MMQNYRPQSYLITIKSQETKLNATAVATAVPCLKFKDIFSHETVQRP